VKLGKPMVGIIGLWWGGTQFPK